MRIVLIRMLLRIMSWLPLPLAHAMGVALGWALFLVDNSQRRTAKINLELCFPEWDAATQRHQLRRVLIEISKTFMESGIVWFCGQQRLQRLVRETVGEALITDGLRQGKGVLLISPHLGNWEMTGLYFSGRYPMTSLYRPPRQAAIDEIIRSSRQRFGAHLVPTNAQGVRALYQAMAQNHLVGILPDQDPRESGGVFAPFFGIQANTMTLVSRLAQKSGAVVICTYAERLSWGRGFRIHVRAVDESVHAKDLTISVSAVNQAMEAAVRHIPKQYQWGYQRFRSRPEGEKEIY
ncbi:MAG: lysophospholipid acyltransferase family protein [Gammaproteobacteria bacterium]|nr:lysophospholipid acyltransferase family protein [Gammaproteobacteria bacterium]